MKPQADDPDIYFVVIPDTDYTIRMWDGGMGLNRQFCLDIFDMHRFVPINLPTGWAFRADSSSMPGIFMIPGELKSFEIVMGFSREAIPEGEEKWFVPEGGHVVLSRPGRPPLKFAVPVRPQSIDDGGVPLIQPKHRGERISY